jgi:hypothetical protein
MTRAIVASLSLLFLPVFSAARGEPPVTFFPGAKIFPVLYADALGHHLSISRIPDNRDWIGTIGGMVPLSDVRVGETTLQLSVAASTFNRLIKPPGITVYTIDYRIDLPFDLRCGVLALRLGFGHYSCHFADDGIEVLGRSSIQYIKDYIVTGISHDLPLNNGVAYLLFQYSYNNVPAQNKPWQVQLGMQGGDVQLLPEVLLYGAVDFKLKQEVAWGTTQSYQVGVKLYSRQSSALRLAYTLRRGFDERGQFFDVRENSNIVSLFVDF